MKRIVNILLFIFPLIAFGQTNEPYLGAIAQVRTVSTLTGTTFEITAGFDCQTNSFEATDIDAGGDFYLLVTAFGGFYRYRITAIDAGNTFANEIKCTIEDLDGGGVPSTGFHVFSEENTIGLFVEEISGANPAILQSITSYNQALITASSGGGIFAPGNNGSSTAISTYTLGSNMSVLGATNNYSFSNLTNFTIDAPNIYLTQTPSNNNTPTSFLIRNTATGEIETVTLGTLLELFGDGDGMFDGSNQLDSWQVTTFGLGGNTTVAAGASDFTIQNTTSDQAFKIDADSAYINFGGYISSNQPNVSGTPAYNLSVDGDGKVILDSLTTYQTPVFSSTGDNSNFALATSAPAAADSIRWQFKFGDVTLYIAGLPSSSWNTSNNRVYDSEGNEYVLSSQGDLGAIANAFDIDFSTTTGTLANFQNISKFQDNELFDGVNIGHDWYQNGFWRNSDQTKTLPAGKINSNFDYVKYLNESDYIGDCWAKYDGDDVIEFVEIINDSLCAYYKTGSDDDYIRIKDASIHRWEESGIIVAHENYDSLVGNTSTSSPPFHYVKDIGDKVYYTFEGSGVKFHYASDNRGGIWGFNVDGGTDTVFVDTYSSSFTSFNAKILFTALSSGTHTLTGTLVGANPSNVSGQTRGWLLFDAAADQKTFVKLEGVSIETTEIEKLLVPNSNKEFAIAIGLAGSNNVTFLPSHGTNSVLKDSPSGYDVINIRFDGRLVDTIADFTPITSVKINQRLGGFIPAQASKIANVESTHSFSDRGVRVSVSLKYLQDVDITGYTMMIPIENAWADTLVDSQGRVYGLDLADGSQENIALSNFCDSFLAYSNSDDYSIAAKVHSTLTLGKNNEQVRIGAKNERAVQFIEHRDNAIQKIYTAIYPTSAAITIDAGSTDFIDFSYKIGKLSNSNQLPISNNNVY